MNWLIRKEWIRWWKVYTRTHKGIHLTYSVGLRIRSTWCILCSAGSRHITSSSSPQTHDHREDSVAETMGDVAAAVRASKPCSRSMSTRGAASDSCSRLSSRAFGRRARWLRAGVVERRRARKHAVWCLAGQSSAADSVLEHSAA